jgi:LmbE family N-acetylglucosaminyl deacetylase
MQRRSFLSGALGGGGMLSGAAAVLPQVPERNRSTLGEVFIERDQPGQPHAGKVLAAIQPHCDDIPIFAGGAVLKLIAEGYTGYLIRTSNDEMAGSGATMGEVVLNNERDTLEVTRRLGLKKLYDLNYRNHLMDGISPLEIRARLIFLFRLLKVDTVFCYDPWGHYEENPDHYVTASSVEAACWMAGSRWDYPEHFEAGLEPHGVSEKYYFARGPQLVNRVVDISTYIDRKVEVNVANVTQGPAGKTGSALRARLAAQGRRLPILGEDEDTADRQYIKHFVCGDNAELGREYGMAYAEAFHYIGPARDPVSEYVEANAVSL